MAFVLTYETLTTTIKDYVERQDARFIDTIPVFLVLGQQRVCKDLKILNIKNVVTDSLTTNVQLVAKPGDWITSNYFNILQPNGEKLILKFRSNEYCDTYL